MPTESPRIVVSPAADALADAVRDGGARLVDQLADADALVWSDPAPDDFPTELPESVRWVQLPLAGIEAWVDGGPVGGDDVDSARTWTSAAGAYAGSVAEHAVALLAAGVRGLPAAARSSSWEPDAIGAPITSLRGATVAIIGCGGIGRAMIPALRGFGASVLAVNRSGRAVDGAEQTVPADRSDEVWAAADHVIIAAPATSATQRLVGAEQLAHLGTHGWLVNIARGSLVDTDALLAALDDGSLAGAALDVTDPEPLPDGHPLWSHPRVIVTPHVANPPHQAAEQLAVRVRENVARFVAGGDLLGIIDADAGY